MVLLSAGLEEGCFAKLLSVKMTGRKKREELCKNSDSKHFPAFENRGWCREGRLKGRCDLRAQVQPVQEELLFGVYKDNHETLCILYLQRTKYCMYFYQVIFRFALALFKYKEEEILKLQDSMSIFKYLRYFTRTILDARWVTQTGVALKDL